MSTMTPHGGVAWSELMTRDVEAAKAYYAASCGWSYDSMKMDNGQDYFVAMSDGKPMAGLMDMADDSKYDGMPSHWFTYFAVDDVDKAVAQTREMSGTIMREPYDVPGIGRIAIVKDPSGAGLGLITEASPD